LHWGLKKLDLEGYFSIKRWIGFIVWWRFLSGFFLCWKTSWIGGRKRDAVLSLYYFFTEIKPVLRDVLLDCPEGPGVPYGEYKRKIFELVPLGGYYA